MDIIELFFLDEVYLDVIENKKGMKFVIMVVCEI